MGLNVCFKCHDSLLLDVRQICVHQVCGVFLLIYLLYSLIVRYASGLVELGTRLFQLLVMLSVVFLYG